MTPGLFGTVAADGKIRVLRERRQKVECPDVVQGCHFGSVFLYERGPLAFSLGILRQFDGFRTWREIREPHVVPIVRSVLTLRNASRRAPNGADAQAFTDHSIGT